MFFKIYFVIFILTEIVNAQSNCGVSGKPSGLIINGSQSNRGQWPWLVAIYKIDENKFICGGSLVSSSYVITVSIF
jgi:secreted trypsin-like serine protease